MGRICSKRYISVRVTGFSISRKQCVILITHSCTFSPSPVLCALGFPPVITAPSSLDNSGDGNGALLLRAEAGNELFCSAASAAHGDKDDPV